MDENGKTIKTLFKKFDEADEKIKWIESFLNSELGFRPTPAALVTDGEVYKKFKEINKILKGNGKMGMITKVMLLWMGHRLSYLLLGGAITWIIKDIITH